MEVHKYIIKKSRGNEDFLDDMCSRKSASTCFSILGHYILHIQMEGQAVAAPGIFLRVFLKKYKLHNLQNYWVRDFLIKYLSIILAKEQTINYKFIWNINKIINYYFLVVSLICLSFINYDLFICCIVVLLIIKLLIII